MAVNGYKFCDLSSDDIDKIKNLENELSDNKNDEEIVLLAFTEEEK